METTPQQVYDRMMEHDHFSAWLGLQLEEIRAGYCRMRYTVRKEMLNGFQIIHGGILFSASDSTFAFACNSHGRVAVALDVSITFLRPAKEGEVLTVTAEEIHLGNKISVYEVRTTNSEGVLLALFKGTAYRTADEVLTRSAAK